MPSTGERRLVLVAAAASALGLHGGCASQPHPSPSLQERVVVNSKSGSRIPAPTVAPVVIDGVRYEQLRNGLVAGFDQMGGLLTAHDVASGALLWTLKVYDNRRVPGKEGDVQDVFFKSMAAQADGTLLIENERGARFIVDVRSRSARPAP
jgi:hypothetical protein